MGPAIKIDRTAFVEISGSDQSAQLENPSLPFRTAQAAADAIISTATADEVWSIILGNSAPQNFGSILLSGKINVNGLGKGSLITGLSFSADYQGQITNLLVETVDIAVITAPGCQVDFFDVEIRRIIDSGNNSPLFSLVGGKLTIRESKINFYNSPLNPLIRSTTLELTFFAISNSVILSDSVTIFDHSNDNIESKFLFLDNRINVTSNQIYIFRPFVVNAAGTGIVVSARNNFIYYVGGSFCFWTIINDIVSANSNQDILAINSPSNLYIADLQNSASLQVLNVNWSNVRGKPGLLNDDGFLVYSATDGQGSLWFEAGESMGYRELNADHTVVPSDRYLVPLVDELTIQLPPAAEIRGRLIQVTPGSEINLINVIPSPGELISNQIQVTVLDYRDSAIFQSTGTEWELISMSQRLTNGNVYDLNIYLATNGNDQNNGLTFDTPVLSLERAQEVMFEKGWNHSVVFNFRAGLYEITPRYSYNFHTTARGGNSYSVVLRGDDPQVIDSGSVSGVAHIPPTGITVISTIVSDSYSGKFIRFISGNLNGLYFQLGVCNTNSLQILANVSPSIGDEFEILQNSTIFHVETNYIRGKALVFQAIDFLVYNQGLSFLDSIVIFDGVTVSVENGNSNALFQSYNSTILTGNYLRVFSPTITTRRLSINLSDLSWLATISTYDLNGVYWSNINHQVVGSNFRCSFLEDVGSSQFTFSQSNAVMTSVLFTSATQGFDLQNFSSVTLARGLIENIDGTLWNSADATLRLLVVTINDVGVIFNTILTDIFVHDLIINSLVSTGESLLDSVIVRGNSIIYNCNRGIRMITTDMSIDNFAVSQISDIVGISLDRATLKVKTFDISNIFSPDAVVSVEGSSLIAGDFNLDASSGLSFSNSNIQIDQFDTSNHVNTTIDILESVVYLNNLQVSDDLRWTSDHSTISIENLSYNGSVSLDFIKAINRSEVIIDSGTFLGSGGNFVSLNGRSRASFSNFTISGVSRVIYGDSDSIELKDVNSSINADGNFHYSLSGSHIIMTNCSFQGNSNTGAFELINCPVVDMDGITINYVTPKVIHLVNSILNVKNSVLNGNSNFHIESIISNVMLEAVKIYQNGDIGLSVSNSFCTIINSEITARSPLYSTSSIVSIENMGIICSGLLAIESLSSTFLLNQLQLVGGTTAGIMLSNSKFSVLNSQCDSDGTGVVISNNSRGILSNVSGSNVLYGIDLISGSSITCQLPNSINGTVGQVNVGNRGIRTWLQISTGLQANCSDILLDPSQYVSISQS